MADALIPKDAEGGGEGEEAQTKVKKKRQNRIRRYCAYYAIKWSLQLLCALIVVLGILWATIQFMRIWNILGVSQEPPGLCVRGV